MRHLCCGKWENNKVFFSLMRARKTATASHWCFDDGWFEVQNNLPIICFVGLLVLRSKFYKLLQWVNFWRDLKSKSLGNVHYVLDLGILWRFNWDLSEGSIKVVWIHGIQSEMS